MLSIDQVNHFALPKVTERDPLILEGKYESSHIFILFVHFHLTVHNILRVTLKYIIKY
jgi:hypothetical protein